MVDLCKLVIESLQSKLYEPGIIVVAAKLLYLTLNACYKTIDCFSRTDRFIIDLIIDSVRLTCRGAVRRMA